VGATALGGQAVGASGRELKRLWRIPLVVIEVGYIPFDPEAGRCSSNSCPLILAALGAPASI
jgi:hypothetical protein